MLKKNDILVAANAKVAEYLADGYMISWMNSSFGYMFRVDLQKNDTFIRIKVEHFSDWSGAIHYLQGLCLSVVSIPRADAFECKDANPLYSKNFYDLSHYGDNEVFTDSLEEKRAAEEKVYMRQVARDHRSIIKLAPTTEVIRKLKKRKGFTNATRNNITVYRNECSYIVTMANHNGGQAKKEVIRFPH